MSESLLDIPKTIDDRWSAYFFDIDHPTVERVGVLFPSDYDTSSGELKITVGYDADVLECSFFKDGEWVLDSVEGFYYADPEGYVFTEEYPSEVTRVYSGVPREELEGFLQAHNGRFTDRPVR